MREVGELHPWAANTVLVRPGTLVTQGNVLRITSHAAPGDLVDSNIDDFVVDNVVLLYRLAADSDAAAG